MSDQSDGGVERRVCLDLFSGLGGREDVEPYDTTLEDVDRDALVDKVDWSLRSPFTHHPWTDEVLLLAGRDYASIYFDALEADAEFGHDAVIDDLDVVDVFAEADLGGIGEQMGWIRRAIDKDLRQPDGGSSEQQTGLSRFAGRTKATVTDGGRRD